MEGFEILIGKDYIDPKLLMGSDPSFARVMGQLNLCVCFAGMYCGKNIAACLVKEHSNGVCEVVDLAIDEDFKAQNLDGVMLHYIMNYARSRGMGYLETGTGNANLDAHNTLLKMGFRVIGVFPDYYQSGGHGLAVQNGIVNRDMIRYRVDFNDGWVNWTEEVKYK